MPFDKLVGPVCPEAKLRKLVRNMIYDGVVAHLLGIDMEEIRKALFKQFGKRKAKAAELNWGAVPGRLRLRREEPSPRPIPYRVERMNATAGKIIIDGNAACALGCMFAGVTVVTWYPITPSSSLVETLIGYLKRFRIDPETGKATYAVVQAEDELAVDRHGDRRRLGRRALHDRHRRARHLADVASSSASATTPRSPP